ncbi:MAG: hypothetical protein BWY74_03699 [Firmicutes bacterium ADurb.Bin419]|nr:MAG: hypothetical protein BWY74_03699 [Firmicutes bacterium ADurb.Bin419]
MFFKAITAFINPTMPALLSRCPRFDLTELTAHIPLSLVYLANALLIPSISIGSPSFVPVPCASIYEMVSGSIFEFFHADTKTFSCAMELGAVNPMELPSLLTALPLITA